MSLPSPQDALQPGKNLLWPSGGKKWLCAAVNRSRRAEVELELCKRARIAAIDVGKLHTVQENVHPPRKSRFQSQPWTAD